MKKLLIAILSAILCIGLLSACSTLTPNGPDDGNHDDGGGGDGKTNLELVEEKYGNLPDATKIEQTIEITAGELLQFSSDKTFVKTSSGYTVTGTEQKINVVKPDGEPYTSREIDETVEAGAFTVKLGFNELYFSGTPTFRDGVFEANVKDDSVENVFGITEEIPVTAAPHGMKLKIATAGEHVTEIAVSYDSNRSNVNITLKFTY